MPPQPASRPGKPPRPALLLSAGAALALLLAVVLPGAHGPASPPPGASTGGPFRLSAADGTTITDRSFRGRYELIYFGYTSCADICPATLNNVAAALDRLGNKAARVQPLFITLDPARDTAPVLLRYARSFTPRLIALTGSETDVQHVAESFRVFSTQGPHGTLDHSSVLYLMGPDGKFLSPIRADASPSAMAHAIAQYVTS